MTRDAFEAHIQCLLNCFPDTRYEDQKNQWVEWLETHDAEQRAMIERLEKKVKPLTEWYTVTFGTHQKKLGTSSKLRHWKRRLGSRPRLSISKKNDCVALGQANAAYAPGAAALDRATGRIVWRFPVTPTAGAAFSGFAGSPAMAGDMVVFGTVDGRVYAFATSSW